MKTVDYLDVLRAKLRLTSDYQLAKRLGVTHQAVSNYRKGRSTFDHVVASRAAALLKIEPVHVIADVELERATTAEARSVWERIVKRVAAGVLVAIGASIAPPPASAAPHSGQVSEPLCIMSNRRRWWFPLLPPSADPADELLT